MVAHDPSRPDRWCRIEELFHEALDRKLPARTEFLRRACSDDTELLEDVEKLLSLHGHDDGFLHPPTSPITPAGADSAGGPWFAGQRLGAFELVRPIASGGMGSVWLAQRADDQFDQRAAIKFMKWSPIADDRRRRFQQERQTLAQLEHPYITRLIDGGTTEGGVPYLVMEYVEGDSIGQYCDRNRLSLDRRLDLFRMVCEAVHYAHQNLVVHRDLKPSNILVTSDGQPKLLDFGISKLLSETAASSNDATATGLRAFTPRYASPEQLRGQPITTATDVYSLGVILYELLSGHRPYELNGQSNALWERVVCEQEPTAPSAVIDRSSELSFRRRAAKTSTAHAVSELSGEQPRQLCRRLRGDLDTVVLKALQKQPQRRYSSVQEFSEDIRRYLARLPVLARPDTLTYRVTKFVRRNRTGVAAAAVVVAALLVGIAGTTAGMHRARAERDIALRVTESLEDVLRAATPYRKGRNRSILGFLEAATERIERNLAGEPAVEARVRLTIARTHERTWVWGNVATNARKALDLNRELYGDGDPSVAESLVLLGNALARDKNEAAVEPLHEALNAHVELYGTEDPRTARAMSALAFALWRAARPPQWEQAESLHREAIAMLRRLPDADPYELALALGDFAHMLLVRGEFPGECESLFLEADRLLQMGFADVSRFAAEYKRLYSVFLYHHGRFEEEAEVLREYLAMTPSSFAAYNNVLRSQWRLADLERELADFPAATLRYRNALVAHCAVGYWHDPEAADQWSALSTSLRATLEPDEIAKHALSMIKLLADWDYSANLPFSRRLAEFAVFLCQGGYAEASETVLAAVAEYQKARHPTEYWSRGYTDNAMGACVLSAGRLQEAKMLLIKSCAPIRRLGIARSHIKTTVYRRMIDLYDALGEPTKAAAYRDMLP